MTTAFFWIRIASVLFMKSVHRYAACFPLWGRGLGTVPKKEKNDRTCQGKEIFSEDGRALFLHRLTGSSSSTLTASIYGARAALLRRDRKAMRFPFASSIHLEARYYDFYFCLGKIKGRSMSSVWLFRVGRLAEKRTTISFSGEGSLIV
jgi:hypothetical protein